MGVSRLAKEALGETLWGTHYSKHAAPLRHLDGNQVLTGARGAERGRLLAMSPEDRARTYFYLNPEDGSLPRPEGVVGAGATYRGKFPGMYNIEENPLKFHGANWESDLKDAGYLGYYHPGYNIGVALQPSTEALYLGPTRAEARGRLDRASGLPDNPTLVTAENLPSTQTAFGRWLAEKVEGDPDLVARYNDEVENLIEQSRLNTRLGVDQYELRGGYGGYKDDVYPGGLVRPNTVIATGSLSDAKKVADARGMATRQDAVPFYRHGAEGVEGVSVGFEGPFTPAAAEDLYRSTGLDFTRTDLDRAELINFDGDPNFQGRLSPYLARNRDQITDVAGFRAEGDYNNTSALWDNPALDEELGSPQRKIDDYNARFQRQYGKASPGLLAGVAGIGGAAATLGAGVLQDAWGVYKGALDTLYGKQPFRDSYSEAVETPWYTSDNPQAQEYLGRLSEGVQAVMDYKPLLRDQTVGEDLSDAWGWYNDSARPWLQEHLGDYGADLTEAGGMLAATFGLPGRSTIRGAQRKAFPGVYKAPDALLAEANGLLVPEDPMLGRLFGVTRQDLSSLSYRQGSDPANFIPGLKPNPKGTAHASLVTKPANTGRLVGALQNAKGSDLATGMEGWYVMDPAYQRILDLVDGDKTEAARRFERLNTFMGIHSANSDVAKEINRGTAANWLYEHGRLGDYFEYGNKNDRLSGRPDRPVDMDAVHGHYAHKTAHGMPLRSYLAAGDVVSTSPKVPAYIGASGVPNVGKGFQNDFAVGDAHYSRAIGLADVRPGGGKQDVTASWSMPEAQELMPWWSDVAAQAGYNPVQAQAVTWGLFSPQTGVQSAIGAPKLEILAGEIEKTARRLGVSPEVARDMVLMGKTHAGFVDPSLLKWLALGGGAAYLGSGLLEGSVEDSGVKERFKPRVID